jgi:ribonuclease HI
LTRRHTAEWAEFLKKKPVEKHPQVEPWQLPPVDWIKINLDGSYHANNEKGGWGFLARDHHGKLLLAGAGAIVNVGEVIASEAQALLHAIEIAEQLGVGRPLFATDCQVI